MTDLDVAAVLAGAAAGAVALIVTIRWAWHARAARRDAPAQLEHPNAGQDPVTGTGRRRRPRLDPPMTGGDR